MSSGTRKAKAAEIRRLLATEGDAIEQNTRGFNAGRYESVSRLQDYEGLKDEARAIKEDAIERLPELLDELRETVEANGGELYLADDAADANRYVREVCADHDAERLVKSKSMTSEELEVNEALETSGVSVTETDLGEWVLQLAEESPSHIVAPAIHKSRESIAELFAERFDPEDLPETAEELTRFAREQLLERVVEADVGMTGANFITADSGTLALVTSEGNARKSALVPPVNVAVAGVEKVVPTVEDLAPFVELIGRSGTGQDITSYLSLFTPPVESPTLDFDAGDPIAGSGNREFHLVLIDNGRLEMREDDQLRETLYCIRCSACSNVCANFQSVGGHAFGGETYSGGIATGWEAGIEGLDTAAEFNDLCTGCSRCTEACPVGIDIPWINTVVRDRINRGDDAEFDWLVEGLTPDEEPGGLPLEKRLFGNFPLLARVGSATAPVSNRLADVGPARTLLERFVGVDADRDLPTFADETLTAWAADRDSSAGDGEYAVTLYADTYTNYLDTARGKATVRTLEALGVDVTASESLPAGRAALSQGMISTATERFERAATHLEEQLDAGRDVVVCEPSVLAMFRDDGEHLLADERFERLRGRTFGAMEYVFGLLENGASVDSLETVDGEALTYHGHCQARTLGVDRYAEAVLDRCGYDVGRTAAECCGMAGSFGYKSSYYDLSRDVGRRLVKELDDAPVAAGGTSCRDQLASFGREATHPIELVAPGHAVDR
jgi:iron-sulfur cluster protein